MPVTLDDPHEATEVTGSGLLCPGFGFRLGALNHLSVPKCGFLQLAWNTW